MLAALAAAMFLLLPGRRQFAASHEARVGQVAREMAAAGWPWEARAVEVGRVRPVKRLGALRLVADPDAPPLHVNPWVVPILNGQVRLQKPPLPYWCAAVLFKVAGVSEASARLSPALLGALATFLLFDLALMLYGRRVAWCASLIWVTIYVVPEEYRAAMADPYLAFFTLACLWAWVRATGSHAGTRGPRDAETRRRGDAGKGPVEDLASFTLSPRPRGALNFFLLIFYGALALGALSKGPLILLHVAVPLVLFHLCFRARPPRSWISHLLGLAVFLAIALPWPLMVIERVPNSLALWRYESVGEITGENQENLRAWWYYLANLPLMAAPWVALWLLSLVWALGRLLVWAQAPSGARLLFPVAWYVLIVLFFSFVGQKKTPYLLPMMPAEALMIAIVAAPLLRMARRTRMRGIPGAVVAIQAAAGVGLVIALAVLVWPFSAERTSALVSCGIALVLSLVAVREMFAVRPMRWFVAQSLTYAAALLIFYHFREAPADNARSPVAVCRELQSLADGTHRAILESKLPEEVAFYLPLHPPHGVAPSAYLVVVDDQKGVSRRAKSGRPEPQVSIEEFEGWVPDAKVVRAQRVPISSAPGDARWKVYELTVERRALAVGAGNARRIRGGGQCPPYAAPECTCSSESDRAAPVRSSSIATS